VKTIIMTMLVLLVSGSGMAADKQTDKDSVKSPVTTGTQKSSGQKTAEKKATVQWPRPYKSTEEVSADSMVPFPTDI
jgi:hypothetical protein